MRLVDEDGEAPAPLLVADLIEDERKLLYRRDDDLLAALDKPAEVTRAFGMPDGGPDLGELLDRVADLLVEDASRSVTTMMESNTPASSFLSPINWWASQAMELDLPLPAECWMRYRFPAPCWRVSAKSRRTTSSWW